MPGVNRICNTKMSFAAGNIELFLRQDVALRNFASDCGPDLSSDEPEIGTIGGKKARAGDAGQSAQSEGHDRKANR